MLDADNNDAEICRYQLTDNYSAIWPVKICSLNRGPNGWQFEAIGEGTIADLNGLLSLYM
ncbi:MAG: TerD family protein [Streptococcus salivarius]